MLSPSEWGLTQAAPSPPRNTSQKHNRAHFRVSELVSHALQRENPGHRPVPPAPKLGKEQQARGEKVKREGGGTRGRGGGGGRRSALPDPFTHVNTDNGSRGSVGDPGATGSGCKRELEGGGPRSPHTRGDPSQVQSRRVRVCGEGGVLARRSWGCGWECRGSGDGKLGGAWGAILRNRGGGGCAGVPRRS